MAIANSALCELEPLITKSELLDDDSGEITEPLLRECREIGNMLNALY